MSDKATDTSKTQSQFNFFLNLEVTEMIPNSFEDDNFKNTLQTMS